MSLIDLVYDTLEILYKNIAVDHRLQIESNYLYFALVGLYSNELISLGYTSMEFTPDFMDSELEALGAMGLSSPVGMDYDTEQGTYVYWIESFP